MPTAPKVKRIIASLGGPAAVASALQLHVSTVFRWGEPKGPPRAGSRANGTGGRIPSRHIPALLKIARAKDVPLSAEELVG